MLDKLKAKLGRKKKVQDDDEKFVINWDQLKKDGLIAMDKRITGLSKRTDILEESVNQLKCPHDIKEFVECVAETSSDGSAINVSKNAHATLTGCTVNYVDRRSDKEKSDDNCWYEVRCAACGKILELYKHSERKLFVSAKADYLVGKNDQTVKEINKLRKLAKDL